MALRRKTAAKVPAKKAAAKPDLPPPPPPKAEPPPPPEDPVIRELKNLQICAIYAGLLQRHTSKSAPLMEMAKQRHKELFGG